MEQKDYKKIGEINKGYLLNVVFGKPTKDYINFCNTQADYFEEEDKGKAIRDETNLYGYKVIKKFNREQFLKYCGIEK